MIQTATHAGRQTREHIVATAAGLFHRQGYHHTGLQQILAQAGVSKGAFYHHFKDKKALALEVIDFFQQFFLQHLAADLADENQPALARLEAFHRRVKTVFDRPGNMAGCPLGNMTLELAGIDRDLQGRLERGFEQLTERFARVIQAGQAAGEITRQRSAMQLAEFFVASWEGAVLRMKSARSTAPLDHWFESIQWLLVKES